MIQINTEDDIKEMRDICSKAAEQIDALTVNNIVKRGVTTLDINDFCHRYTSVLQECIPGPIAYKGYPKAICTSVNHVACHGIPTDKKVLKDNDIINIDITPKNDKGYHGDTSVMFIIGKGNVIGKRLCKVTQECLYAGIKQVKPGAPLNAIGKVIEAHARKNNLQVLPQFTGHGINTTFHDDPTIFHVYNEHDTTVMEPGMIFTVEPILTVGKPEIRLLPDGWTYVTKDHKPTAQWEHTILVTETGYDILTYRDGEEIDKIS